MGVTRDDHGELGDEREREMFQENESDAVDVGRHGFRDGSAAFQSLEEGDAAEHAVPEHREQGVGVYVAGVVHTIPVSPFPSGVPDRVHIDHLATGKRS